MRSKKSQYGSPLGPYDSPYTSPPGPYDSPESDTDDKEESTSENVVTRFGCSRGFCLQFKLLSCEMSQVQFVAVSFCQLCCLPLSPSSIISGNTG